MDESQVVDQTMSDAEVEGDVEEVEDEEVEEADESQDAEVESGGDDDDVEDEEDEESESGDEEETADSVVDEEDSSMAVPEDEPSSSQLISVVKKPKSEPASSGTVTPTETPKPTPKRRGRPPRARVEPAAVAAAVETPTPKRRGRKPRPPEEKARIKEEKKQLKREMKKKATLDRKKAKEQAKLEAKKAREEKKKNKVRGKRGRKFLTEEEKEAREIARKQKYEEIKRIKLEKAEKKRVRNEELRERRKQRKAEEQKQREAYEKRMQELKASFLDETTTMSGDGAGLDLDENSQSSMSSMKVRRYGDPGQNEMSQLGTIRSVTAATLLEYRWPLEGKDSEHYFLQEQVSEYLDVKSFKRRYPDVHRRNVGKEERDFLVEMKVVNETQADLGLTAIPSSQVLDIMSDDFYDKYNEYMAVVMERKDRTMRQTNYSLANVDKGEMLDFVERAVRSTADWNKTMNQERREKRSVYFDPQTFALHYPMTNRGKMKVLKKPELGHYPIALIPGQFVDYYEKLRPSQLKYLPLNTATKAPPKKERLRDLISDGEESDSSMSSSSDSSSSDSSSDEDEEMRDGSEVKKETVQKPKKPIDMDLPGATCKVCQGDRKRNKNGIPEKMLHCTKCQSSCHPTCVSLSLELLHHVTSYCWECTDCKGCSKCKDHTDEENMLFCDLCDRGYHIYCVGLEAIPSGRWHCVECAQCSSCGTKEVKGEEEQSTAKKWAFEYKIGNLGNKIFSHMMCTPCHRLYKKGAFCPECNVCFGMESKESDYYQCWVCSRQHHSHCVGQERFICGVCQQKTLSKKIGAGNFGSSSSSASNSQFGVTDSYGRTPRSSRRSNVGYSQYAA